MNRKKALGIDIGSTTTKLVLLEGDRVLYEKYQRHLSRVRQTTLEMLREMQEKIQPDMVSVTISGSAGMGLAEAAGLPFVQEVYATGEVVRRKAPDTGVVIELGGEDAKVIFFDGGVDERIERQLAETQVIAEMVKTAVKENASTAQSQEAYLKKYEALTERYEKAATELERLQTERTARTQQDKKIALFIRTFKKMPDTMTDWDDTIWTVMVEKGIVHKDGGITFVFKNGTEVEVGA